MAKPINTSQTKDPIKPCQNLCVRYHDGICHNYCQLTEEQRHIKTKELEQLLPGNTIKKDILS
ncbi:hypothetical protein [Thalassomonas sp. RHCl1]|uniref:hypothetical protein n=1 Tax=Thalassomonas sp. RHCl1 TaxID=2995320 RepID=UPI00248CF292|nr:hypothetical protein [Thalassomonas sp. RHCl1]